MVEPGLEEFMQQTFFNKPPPTSENKKPAPKKGKGKASKKGKVPNKAKPKENTPSKDVLYEENIPECQQNACTSIENNQDLKAEEVASATEEGKIPIERSNNQMKNLLNSSKVAAENFSLNSDIGPDVVSATGNKHAASCDCAECDEMDYLLGFVNGQPYGIKEMMRDIQP